MTPPTADPSPDDHFMDLALREARKGAGFTSPNPSVGAVIVRDGIVIARGHHRKAGGPHAEIEALREAEKSGTSVRGTTIFITLEPCSTTGRTPPCCDALASAGLARVVWSVDDPNPAHAGRAAALLAEKGLSVTTGVRAAEGGRLLAPWAKFITTGLPWVILKAGLSLDGKITRPFGEGQWLTSEAARADALKLRARVDAILIGAETLRKDNPRLTLRSAGKPGREQPWRVVFTRSGRLPQGAHLFTDEHKDRSLVISKAKTLEPALRELARERGVVTALVEGGGTLIAQMLAQQLADEVCFYLAPLLCGTGRPVIDPGWFAGGSVALREVKFRALGDNMRVTGLV